MAGNTKAALDFLRVTLRKYFDLNKEVDRKTFESLASIIFCESTIDPAPYLAGQVTLEELLDTPVVNPINLMDDEEASSYSTTIRKSTEEKQTNIHHSRNAVYERLTQYFPIHMTQPSLNLTDLLPCD